MLHEETTTVTMWLEGFEEPLHVTVFKSINENEFRDLTKEILRNYLLDLKDKKAIRKDMEDVIIISKVALAKVRMTSKRWPRQTCTRLIASEKL